MTPMLPIHILAGSIALLSGFAALALRKGGKRHGRVGSWFFAAMTVMTLSGAVIAAFKPERGTAVIGLFTCYLVATAWMAARRRDGRFGRFELAGCLVACACAAAMLGLGLLGLASPNGRVDSLPAVVHFPFAVLAALAAALDLNFLARGRLVLHQRIARHLWRMCAALLIASTSFFFGQQKVMPEAIQGSALLSLPPLIVLTALVFWILRARFSRRFGGGRRRAGDTLPSRPEPAALALPTP